MDGVIIVVMTKTRVGVLRGGPSPEYEVSIKTGASVLKHLPLHYEGRDIFIDKKGIWHRDGIPVLYEDVFRDTDVFFNALHGTYGEDGTVQRLLDGHRAKYTGSGILGSAIAMQKHLAKEHFKKAQIKTPYHVHLKKADEDMMVHVRTVFNTMPPPWFVKPANAGSSVGAMHARTMEGLVPALEIAFGVSDEVLVEELIEGREATVGVVEDFRGYKTYALPVIEIVPPKERDFFDYISKYDGNTQEICPGRFSRPEILELQDFAIRAHNALGLRHYSRTDFIVSKKGIYVLETNTLPGLTEESLLPKSVQAIGATFPQFLDHILTLALR